MEQSGVEWCRALERTLRTAPRAVSGDSFAATDTILGQLICTSEKF